MKKIIKNLLIIFLKKRKGNFKKNSDSIAMKVIAQKELQKVRLNERLVSSQADEWWRSEEMEALNQLLQPGGLESFLRLEAICETMNEFYSPMLIKEYFWLLKKSLGSKFKVKDLIWEDETGKPIPFLLNSSTSGNLMHHTYHYLKFRDFCKSAYGQIDHILEFGGGYGSICRVFFRAGYLGNYTIIDLKTFSILQSYFLNSIGIPTQLFPERSFPHDKPNVNCISDVKFLDGLQLSRTLFIATWSLSETGIEMRDLYKSKMDQCSNFMLAFRDTFEGVDNLSWFNSYINVRSDVDWHLERIKHIPNSYYLFGKPKSSNKNSLEI